MQFDSAVTYFGTTLENKLSEYDKDTHKPIYNLKELLESEDDPQPKSVLDLLGSIREPGFVGSKKVITIPKSVENAKP